jgi:hypothetical protein
MGIRRVPDQEGRPSSSLNQKAKKPSQPTEGHAVLQCLQSVFLEGRESLRPKELFSRV